MTRINLLEQMKEFSEVLTSDLFLPVQMQEEDEEQGKKRKGIMSLLAKEKKDGEKTDE